MNVPILLITIGVLFLAGLALDSIGRRVHVPRVTLLMVLGAVVGPPVLDILPDPIAGTNDIFAAIALTMVAFLLGGGLKRQTLRTHGREIMIASLVIVVTSVVIVGGGLVLLGYPVVLALLLAGVSGATDPAATQDVIRQAGAKSRFATNLLGIVAVDDAWGLLAFSIILTFVSIHLGNGTGDALLHGLWEVGGAIGLGLAIGLPAAFLTGRIKSGEPILIEALGVVSLCTGGALYLGVSFLLTGMACGVIITNTARHHKRPFHAIERIEWPFLLMFFVMAGASLQTRNMGIIAPVAIAYIGLRFVARIIGGWTGGRLAGLPKAECRMNGLALMPQAGVAIGMALVAAERFPEIGQTLLAVTIASTIAFEILGPMLTQFALAKVQSPDTPEMDSGMG